ncbi:MAG: M20/M25/M40 family metallo-hydrolase [Bacteroidales bacterium]|nr:M20/M25/M40 family metallo-hydrolase [Bacteroidales bacterium]
MYPLSFNKPNIIFLNHIDVVLADNCELFTYPPFSGTIADGQVWGRGAIDSKGMAVMQLLANDPNKKVFTISTTFKRSL